MWTCLFIYNDTAQARLDWGAGVIQSGKKLSLMVSLESSRRYLEFISSSRRRTMSGLYNPTAPLLSFITAMKCPPTPAAPPMQTPITMPCPL